MNRKKTLKIHSVEPVSVKAKLTTSSEESGELMGVFTDNTNKIVMAGKGVVKTLEVTIAVTETEDVQLLHKMLAGIRREYTAGTTPSK